MQAQSPEKSQDAPRTRSYTWMQSRPKPFPDRPSTQSWTKKTCPSSLTSSWCSKAQRLTSSIATACRTTCSGPPLAVIRSSGITSAPGRKGRRVPSNSTIPESYRCYATYILKCPASLSSRRRRTSLKPTAQEITRLKMSLTAVTRSQPGMRA